jgi:hypothetical protein
MPAYVAYENKRRSARGLHVGRIFRKYPPNIERFRADRRSFHGTCGAWCWEEYHTPIECIPDMDLLRQSGLSGQMTVKTAGFQRGDGHRIRRSPKTARRWRKSWQQCPHVGESLPLRPFVSNRTQTDRLNCRSWHPTSRWRKGSLHNTRRLLFVMPRARGNMGRFQSAATPLSGKRDFRRR